MKLCLIFVVVASLIAQSGAAQDLVGAKEALRIFREKAEQRAEQAANPAFEESEFDKALAAYTKDRPGLKPPVVAARWLALYDLSRESADDDEQDPFNSSESNWDRVLNVLPSPDSWEALSTQIRARGLPQELPEMIRARGLRALAARLTGDDKLLQIQLNALEKAIIAPAEDAPKPDTDDPAVVDEIIKGFVGSRRGGSGQYSQLTQAIAGLRTASGAGDPVATFLAALKAVDPSWGGNSASVPDLVGLVGEERATDLLLQAFKIPGLQLSFNEKKEATLKLARKVASENIADLGAPPWALCLSTDTGELFEALVKRFAEVDAEEEQRGFGLRDNYTYRQAASFYFRGLILRGEDKAAMRLYVENSEREASYRGLFVAWSKLRETAEERLTIFRFFLTLVEAHPELDAWSQLTAIGAQVGRADEVRAVVERVAARDDLQDSVRQTIEGMRAGVLLAASEVDAAIEVIRQQIATMKGKDAEVTRGELAWRMMTIGRLMKRAESANEGMAVLDKLFETAAEQKPDPRRAGNSSLAGALFNSYVNELISRDRAGKAEELLITAAAQNNRGGYGGGPTGLLLANLYLKLERYEDVVTLLDEATWWSEDDLESAVLGGWESMSMRSANDAKSLAYIAAHAFANTGRRDLAKQITERLVVANPGKDAAWALMLELAGDDFPEIANRVFQRDQFEERPLIWLARHQLNGGDIATAEKTIRRAIAIDPSDGEQGKGDRMRAYAVLADILAKKGDDQAELFRGAVRAIRMAEDADDFFEAGLLSDGIALYRASLEQFADAYCIQSRLAIQLAAQGDFEAAAKHYERAFELMPDSFGRVESHCFGCEGAFEGELAGNIAERVFNRLSAERPNDPKVRYLIGYLRSSQGRYDEALQNYQQATTLDPDYLNAWKNINGLQGNMAVPREMLDEAVLNIYRLAPLRARYGSGLDSVVDLKRLWNAVAEVEQRIPKAEAGALYRLKAAAESRATAQGNDLFGNDPFGGPHMAYSSSSANVNNPASPNEALSTNTSITYVSQIVGTVAQ